MSKSFKNFLNSNVYAFSVSYSMCSVISYCHLEETADSHECPYGGSMERESWMFDWCVYTLGNWMVSNRLKLNVDEALQFTAELAVTISNRQLIVLLIIGIVAVTAFETARSSGHSMLSCLRRTMWMVFWCFTQVFQRASTTTLNSTTRLTTDVLHSRV